MNDTVILATSREAMTKKLELLYRAAKGIDMAIHPTKSQFMTVNVADHIPFEIENVKISYTSTYTYLGSIIEDAPIRDQVKTHIDSKRGHIRKFSSFLRKNAEAPFKVKKVVLESVMKGSILYGCESWLCEDMQLVNQVTAAAQKQLLGVRTQTCTDLAQLELSSGSAKSQVQDRQTRFLKKVVMRDYFNQSPVCRAIELAQTAGSPAGRYLQSLLRGTSRPIEKDLERVKARVRQSASSRRVTYRLFNPEQNIHRIYGDATVPESDRVAFTRLRLGSHFLKIETGRWARIERERRLCACGQIQTEQHILLNCPFTLTIRARYSQLSFTNLRVLMAADNVADLAKYCRQALQKVYERNA